MKRTTLQVLKVKERIEQTRTETYGPPPVNYIKTLRMADNLSIQELADRMGITKQALIRLEQGTYDHILPTALDYYVENYADSELRLVESYEAFQSAMRERHHRYFGDLYVPADIHDHPLRFLRAKCGVNPTEVAKSLCVPQATVVHFERKPKLQKSVPKCLISALHECGYSGQELREFEEAYATYRSQLLGLNVIQLRD